MNTQPMCPVKKKDGKTITIKSQDRKQWAQHFTEILNRPPLKQTPSIPPANSLLDIKINPPTKAEIIKAMKNIKAVKAAGPDDIPPEALKSQCPYNKQHGPPPATENLNTR